MGIWYSLNGEIEIHRTPETEEMVDYLPGWMKIRKRKEKSFVLEVGFNDHISCTGASDLEDEVEEFSPFMVEPCFVETECDDDKGWIYLGPKERRKEAISRRVLGDIQEKLVELTHEDRVKLKEMLG